MELMPQMKQLISINGMESMTMVGLSVFTLCFFFAKKTTFHSLQTKKNKKKKNKK